MRRERSRIKQSYHRNKSPCNTLCARGALEAVIPPTELPPSCAPGPWSILMRSKLGSNYLVYNANLADGSPSGGDSEPKRQALKTVVGKGVLPLRPAMRRYLEGKTL